MVKAYKRDRSYTTAFHPTIEAIKSRARSLKPIFTLSQFTGPGRAKKAPLVWSRCKASRRWTDKGSHGLAGDAAELEASWRCGQPRSRQARSLSPDRESSATHDGERTGWKSLVSSRRTVEHEMPPSVTWSTRLAIPAQPAPSECRHKSKNFSPR